VWRFAIFYGPLWVVFLLIVGLYGAVLWNLRRSLRQLGDTRAQAGQRLFRRLFAYPLTVFVVWLVPTVTRILEYALPHPLFPLYAVHSFTIPLMGALNATAALVFDGQLRSLLFGAGPSVKRQTQGAAAAAAAEQDWALAAGAPLTLSETDMTMLSEPVLKLSADE
jgi:hypothetical protein